MEKEIAKALEKMSGVLKSLDARVTRLEARASQAHGSNSAAGATKAKKVSIKEFLLGCKPSDDVQRTLAIAVFLETQREIPSFNRTDLEKAYREAKERVPGNINDKVNISIRHGNLMEADDKKDGMKSWTVTRSGMEYFKNRFKKDDERAS